MQRRLVYLVAAASCAGTVVACEHPSGPGLAPDAYRIVEVGVEVEPTTRRGRPWDDAPGELPDLEIRIRIDDRVGGSCKLPDDQTRGRCKLDLAFQLEPDTRIRLDVVDRDTLVDDPIGTAALTDPSSWSVALPLPLQPAGRLRAATVVLRRPPTLWDRHRGRLIGLGVGVALALAALWTFRGGLLAAAPRPAPTPRCTHCGVFLGMDTSRCTHCGAAQKEAVG